MQIRLSRSLSVLVLVATGALSGACSKQDRGDPPDYSVVTRADTPATVVDNHTPPPPSKPASEPAPTPAPEPAEPAEPAEPECEEPAKVSLAQLMVLWPQFAGKRVEFPARIERTVGLTDVVVTAPGGRFVVMMAPDEMWTGTARRTFRVMGSSRAIRFGRAPMPELALETDDDCAGPSS